MLIQYYFYPDPTAVSCRYDWHQTASHVTVAVYAKKYDPETSYLEVRPLMAESCTRPCLPTSNLTVFPSSSLVR